jgi:hypothetical protein
MIVIIRGNSTKCYSCEACNLNNDKDLFLLSPWEVLIHLNSHIKNDDIIRPQTVDFLEGEKMKYTYPDYYSYDD